MRSIFKIFVLSTICANAFADNTSIDNTDPDLINASEYKSCIKGDFTAGPPSGPIRLITLQVTNKCNAPVDVRNAKITYELTAPHDAKFWGTFQPLSYPIAPLEVKSQAVSSGRFLASFVLNFNPKGKTILPANQSFTVKYNAKTDGYFANSFKAYVETGGNPTPPTPTPKTPLAQHGQLKVCGTHLCNEKNEQIQLKGVSTHGLQWKGVNVCLTEPSLNAMVDVFQAQILRIAMYIQSGGYETNPVKFTQDVNYLIEAAYKRGMYALVDFHVMTPGDPMYNLDRAKKFFTDIAKAHKDKKNIIYEIANEPNGVPWSTIKNYAMQIIPVIRAIDADAPIIVGTPGWSSLGISDGRNSQDIINNPVPFQNIMYTFHFYAASHRDNHLAELDRASNVLPIFVTEFGTMAYTGDGPSDFAMSDKYMELMARKKISWVNWNYSDDYRTSGLWLDNTCPSGPWVNASLKNSGVYIKNKIIG